MSVEVCVGDRDNWSDVYATGSVVARQGGSVQLRFSGVILNLNFDDAPGLEPAVHIGGIDNEANLTVVNFNNPLGTCTAIPIAVHDGRNMALHLAVHAIGDKTPDRIVHYSLVLEPRR